MTFTVGGQVLNAAFPAPDLVSIGVIVQVPNVTELLDDLGVDVRSIKSTPLKAAPSPFEPVSEDAEAMMRRMVLSSYGWFVDLVRERRGMSEAQIRAVADGSVFSGIQGLENDLVDALGGEDAVEAYLATREVAPGLPVIRYEPPRDDPFALFAQAGEAVGAGLGRALGLPALADRLAPVDGLIALWQGRATGE